MTAAHARSDRVGRVLWRVCFTLAVVSMVAFFAALFAERWQSATRFLILEIVMVAGCLFIDSVMRGR